MPEPTMTPTPSAPQHSSTPMAAITRHSEVISPVSIDPDEGSEEGTEEILEDLKADDEEKNPNPKEKELKFNGDQETDLKLPECQDSIHEFEKRTKQYLAAPAK